MIDDIETREKIMEIKKESDTIKELFGIDMYKKEVKKAFADSSEIAKQIVALLGFQPLKKEEVKKLYKLISVNDNNAVCDYMDELESKYGDEERLNVAYELIQQHYYIMKAIEE